MGLDHHHRTSYASFSHSIISQVAGTHQAEAFHVVACHALRAWRTLEMALKHGTELQVTSQTS